MARQPRIFFSYSAKDMDAANEIYLGLKKHGLSLTRDDTAVKYTESWVKFMDTVKDHDFAIALISKNYLESPNCMYEMLQFQGVKDFEERIIPITTDNHLFTNRHILPDYLNYWDKMVGELKHLQTSASPQVQMQIKVAKDARNYIEHFIPFLKTIKTIDLNVAVEKTYLEILRKVNRKVDPEQQIRIYETTLYDTLLTDVIDGLNAERAAVIGAIDDPKDLGLLLERRFKFRIRDAVRNRIREFARSGKAPDSRIIDRLNQLESLDAEQLFEEFLSAKDVPDATLAGHVLSDAWEKSGRFDREKILPLLEQPDFPYHKLAVIAELMERAGDAAIAEPVEEWLRRHLYLVKGREQTEVWALFCDLLKRIDNKRYQQLFALAHYVFLKKRDTETEPYKYPLLSNISGFKPDAETYINLLDGTDDEKLAAVWVLSFFGGIYIFLCNRNYSPVALPQRSKNILVELSNTPMDYKDKWRLCCAAASTHLLELIPWLKTQTQAADMLSNRVSINHPTYDLIVEPEAAMAIRACGYFALLSKEKGDTAQADDLQEFLLDLNANRRRNEDPYLVVALATALGYLGNGRPLLFLVRKHREPWVLEAALNACINRTDRKGKAECRAWIWDNIGKSRLEIEHHPDLTPLAKKTYIEILEELEARLGFV